MSNNKITNIPLAQLFLDPENPRIPSSVNRYDEAAVLEWMLEDASLLDLMKSIGEQGYFSGEPLLVTPNPDQMDQYIVVEGNRRLAALKLLTNPSLATSRVKSVNIVNDTAVHKPTEIPVVVYSIKDEIIDYLGYRHVTGIKPWKTLAKAKYIRMLFEKLKKEMPETDHEDLFNQIARTLGSRSDYLKRLLTGLILYEVIENNDFYEIYGLTENTFEFTLLTTALGYKNIVSFLGLTNNQDYSLANLENEQLRELATWIYKRNESGQKIYISDSRELSKLSNVIGTTYALEVFREGAPLSEAIIHTSIPKDIISGALREAKHQLIFAKSNSHKALDLGKTELKILVEIITISNELQAAIESRQEVTE